jgi:hypothetical protein
MIDQLVKNIFYKDEKEYDQINNALDYYKKYVNTLLNGNIPDYNWTTHAKGIIRNIYNYRFRRIITVDLGIWPILEKEWLDQLAKHLQGKKCLEIMAAGGAITKGLLDRDINIIATDNYSWNEKEDVHTNLIKFTHVEKLDAINSVTKYNNDYNTLICSWPPCDDCELAIAAKNWSGEIIYIGEDNGGCNANDEFFNHFEILDEIEIPRWQGIYDNLYIGKYHD